MTIVEFLTARLDEREATAKGAPGPTWITGYEVAGEPGRRTGIRAWLVALPGEAHSINVGPTVASCQDQLATDHIAANDPAYVLADIAAKRAIIARHVLKVERVPLPEFDSFTGERNPPTFDVTCAVCQWVTDNPTSGCDDIKHLALPFADRPGYDEAWRP